MIQGWYCKEKLDASHSLGVKGLMLQTWSKSDLQLPYHSKLFFAIKTIPSGYLPDSHETNTLDHKGFLFVGKTVAKQTKTTINVYKTVNYKNEKIVMPYWRNRSILQQHPAFSKSHRVTY